MGHGINFIPTIRACALIALALSLPISAAMAQNTVAATALAASAFGSDVKSDWSTLSAEQQQALAPLATDWDRLDSAHKKKWLAIGNKFPSMKPEERTRIQNRMREWVKLSPQQRRIARENYWRAKKINPDQKSAHWQQYQQLPDAQKKKLAAAASKKKGVSVPGAHKNNDVLLANPKKMPPQPAQTQDRDSSILTPSVPPDIK